MGKWESVENIQAAFQLSSFLLSMMWYKAQITADTAHIPLSLSYTILPSFVDETLVYLAWGSNSLLTQRENRLKNRINRMG